MVLDYCKVLVKLQMCKGWSMINRVKIISKVVSVWKGCVISINLREVNHLLMVLNLKAVLIKQEQFLFTLRNQNNEKYVVNFQCE